MGFVARAFTRRNIVAIAVGVLLAGVPLVAFDFWLSGLIDRQGQEEVNTSARRAIALAESRVAQAIETLDALAAHGVDSCRPSQIETMRRAAFDTIPIKEIAVVAGDGQTQCTNLGLPLGLRTVISSEPLFGAPGYTLDIIALERGQRVVRLRRKVGEGPNGIAALMPSALFLPQVSTQGERFSAFARIATHDDAVIGEHGVRPSGTGKAFFVAASQSSKYGFGVEISAARGSVEASHADLKWLGMFATGAIVLILGIFAMLMPRRSIGNPVAEIERALDAGEFVPYYQPIVDIRSGQLRGAEVLVRWRKPDGTLVLPGAFIPLAESSGLIREMTRDLMRRVCVEAGPAIGCRPALKVSFNFAGQLFSDQSIVKEVRNIFSGSPIKLSQVVLEVTERDPIENFTATRQTIAALQGLGVRIAIDDVGTGHSGLSYMLKLGVDIIKIDKMFVDAIGTDRNSTTIVETLIDLAHNMRMDVVAEGVENFEQVMHLRELGIRSAQGYVFAPPLPGSAFLQLIEAIDPLQRAAEPEIESMQAALSPA
ncbi:MAG TPA: EAL domain-containing protein [Pseudolabrys sp.]|jgi:sensor c-di-GMP phosphodiesterase-like protein|nr:EAL domain-containing protein [Pseudolabrys sp.]